MILSHIIKKGREELIRTREKTSIYSVLITHIFVVFLITKSLEMKTSTIKIQQVMGTIALIFAFFSIGVAQGLNQNHFESVDALLKSHVESGLVDYASLQNSKELNNLIEEIAETDLTGLDDNTIQAFYINAYNLHVINEVVKDYPIKSVKESAGFFDKKKIRVAGKELTLNKLEKENLLSVYKDARFHFVLVCGANGCPPITNFAYTPDKLEQQLEQQTKKALNDPAFIRTGTDAVELSEIFRWYASDFGKNKEEVIAFINKYRNNPITKSTKLKYYNYDWNLNDTAKGFGSLDQLNNASNESRYIVSSTIPKGSTEIKIFNNLYSQETGETRSSFYTTSLSILYGLNNRFNVGLATRFRKVRNNPLPSSPFSVFGSGGNGSSRIGLTALGPQIRYAPNPKWKNFSIQSSFVFPIGQELAGNEDEPYIDWNGATWNTQFFNDLSIGTKFSLFTEVDILLEDIGRLSEGHNNRLSTPVTVIFSYVPTNKLTIYTLAGYSPFWQFEFDYFTQLGLGTKYQFTPNFEIELLYTDFSNKFLNSSGGKAETINLGIRMNV